MEFKSHLFKSWFTLAEVQQLLKDNYKFEHTKKEIIGTLSRYSKFINLYFYAEYNGEINQLIITDKKQDFGKMEFIINPDLDYENLHPEHYLKKGLVKILNQKESVLKEDKIFISSFFSRNEFDYFRDKLSSEIIITTEEKPFIQYFKGLLCIPEICFNDVLFNLGDDENLILPETSFYNSYYERYSLKDGDYTSVYPNFLFIRFNPAALGSIDLAKVLIFAADFSYIANIFEYENEQREAKALEDDGEPQEQTHTPKPPKPQKTVKNKSNDLSENRTIRSKKDFFTPMILASIHATAQAYPDLGGYQIIKAIIGALKSEKGFKDSDFFTPEGYLKKFKKAYNHTFPQNSGRHKANITPIIIEQND